MAELQRSVALAERRALDSVAGERIKMELLLETAAAQQVKRIAASNAAACSSAANSNTNNGPPSAATSSQKEEDPQTSTGIAAAGGAGNAEQVRKASSFRKGVRGWMVCMSNYPKFFKYQNTEPNSTGLNLFVYPGYSPVCRSISNIVLYT